jgi:hypothetical protein
MDTTATTPATARATEEDDMARTVDAKALTMLTVDDVETIRAAMLDAICMVDDCLRETPADAELRETLVLYQGLYRRLDTP